MATKTVIEDTQLEILANVRFDLWEETSCAHFLINSIHKGSDARSDIEDFAEKRRFIDFKLSIEELIESF